MVYSQGVMLGRSRLIGPSGGCKEIVLAAEGDCISISDGWREGGCDRGRKNPGLDV